MVSKRYKKFETFLTSLLIISLFICMGFIGFSMECRQVSADGPTEISGVISLNTTWTTTNGPYHITDNTTLIVGKVLNIQAGTIVKFVNNTRLTIRGTLNVNGNDFNHVIFTNKDPLYEYTRHFSDEDEGKDYWYNGRGVDYNIFIDQDNSGKINVSYAKFEYSSHNMGAILFLGENKKKHEITDTLFKNNDHGIHGGGEDLVIQRCTFKNNHRGIIGGHGSLLNSTFQNNTIGIYNSDYIIINNCSLNNNKYGFMGGTINLRYSKVSKNYIGIKTEWESLELKVNSINDNSIGVILPKAGYHYLIVKYNNICNNSDYNLKVASSSNIHVRNNWWGTSNTEIIDQYIYDIWDEPSLGEANYKPFLTSPTDIANKPPIPDAGPDQNASVNQVVYFDGSGSYDPYEDILTYFWDFGNGISTDWQIDCNVSYSYNLPGNYNVVLMVNDGEFIDDDTCTIKVSVPVSNNIAPVANAGPDQNASVNQVVYFDGSNSYDFNRDNLTYFWDFGDGISTNWQIDFNATHSYDDPGKYTVTLRVSDGKSVDNDTCIVQILPKGGDRPQLADSPWPCFRGNAQHTGLSPYDTSHNTGNLKWKFETWDDIISPPSIGPDGTIYVGSNDHYLYAINLDGTEKWRFKIDGLAINSPALASDGTCYTGSHDYLYAINSNGTLKWKFEGTNSIRSSPALGSSGTIYVGFYDGLYAIYPDGILKWKFKTKDIVESTPAIGSDDTIYVGSYDNKLYAINPDGSEIWNFSTSGGIYSSPAIGSDNTIYFGSSDGYLYALNSKGSEKWKIQVDCVHSSPAIGANGNIYINSQGGTLYSVLSNGILDWNYKVEDSKYMSPAIGSDGTIYIGSERRSHLSAINPDGTLKWQFKAIWDIVSPIIGFGGIIYFSSHHSLYALGNDGDSDSKDTDGDGIPDDWETQYSFNPNDPGDSQFDFDNDSLTNLEEYQIGSDPTKKDTDGDGYLDNADAYPNDPNKYLPEKVEDDGELEAFTIIFIIMIIVIILIILMLTYFVLRSKRKPIGKPLSENKLVNQLINEILYNKENKDIEMSNAELRALLYKKYNKGEVSNETYLYFMNNILNKE